MAALPSQKRHEGVDCTMEFAQTRRIHETLTIIIKDNIWLTKTAALCRVPNEYGGVSPAVSILILAFCDQRSS
jgi:hypothetical protein